MNPFQPIEIAPIVNEFPGGAVFQGYGNSHFTLDQRQFHTTTEIPGLGQGMPIVDRFDIPQNGF